jgi:hypothetical protein
VSRLQENLVAVERQGWEALRSGTAGDYYRKHLTPDAVMAFPFGVLAREQCIEAMESAPPWTAYDMQDPQVITLTADCGIVVYRVVAERSGQEPYKATISSTFVRRSGTWQLAFHQQSPV